MRSRVSGIRPFAIGLVFLAGAAIAVPAFSQDRIDVSSERPFDETVQRLQWSIGGHGLTVVLAMNYDDVLKGKKQPVAHAVVFEVMRRDWARRLLDADKAQGLLLPVRLYAFEDASSRTVVSYFRPWSALESVDNESLRNLARQMDAVIGEIVRESTSKIP